MTNRWIAALRGTLLAVGAFGWMTCAAGAAQYGTAVVEQGQMTILRDGRAVAYQASSEPVDVNEKDIVRVREASRIVLKTQDRATLTLGANAVFQCEPWEVQDKSGMFRLLFGRFRASVATLAGTQRFNVKAATATIGVKGTEFIVATTSVGNTAVLGLENTVTLAGHDGVDQHVGPNQVSVVVGHHGATPPVTAPPEFAKGMGNINSPSVGSPEARDLPSENVLVEYGIVSKDALDQSKDQTPPEQQQQQQQQEGPPVPQPSINMDDAQQAGASVRGKVGVSFEK